MLTKEGVKAEQAIPWHEYMYLRMMNRSGYMHLRVFVHAPLLDARLPYFLRAGLLATILGGGFFQTPVFHFPLLPPDTLLRAPVCGRASRRDHSPAQAARSTIMVLFAFLASVAVQVALLILRLSVDSQCDGIDDAATVSQCLSLSVTRMQT